MMIMFLVLLIIMTFVAKKWNLNVYPDPSQWENQKNNIIQPFLIIIDHTGDFKDICISWLMMELTLIVILSLNFHLSKLSDSWTKSHKYYLMNYTAKSIRFFY
jgi:hypothetical protein